MSSLLYLFGILAAIGCGLSLVTAQSAVHEGVAAILAVATICAVGLGRCVTLLEKISKTASSADQNNWTVNKAIWKQLRDPQPADKPPKADGD